MDKDTFYDLYDKNIIPTSTIPEWKKEARKDVRDDYTGWLQILSNGRFILDEGMDAYIKEYRIQRVKQMLKRE